MHVWWVGEGLWRRAAGSRKAAAGGEANSEAWAGLERAHGAGALRTSAQESLHHACAQAAL